MSEVTLREATVSDARVIWLWRNDPDTVAASLSAAGVDWDEHLEWYRRVLEDPMRHLLVVERENRSVGMLRLDQINETEAEISINIAPTLRGQGLGSQSLVAALEWAGSKGRLKTILARVRADNEASVRAFAAAGFVQVAEQSQAEQSQVLELVVRLAGQ